MELPEGKILIPGVVSHATNVVEHPELVADRLIAYANAIGRENVASSTAVSSKSPQNAKRIRLSGRRLANATPAEIAAMPPSARGNPTTQSTLPAPA